MRTIPPDSGAPPTDSATPAGAVDPLDDWLAAPMWGVTLAWLFFLATAIQDLRDNVDLSAGTHWYLWGLGVTWALMAVEWILLAIAGQPNLRYHALYVMLPPLRLGARDHETWRKIWLPKSGWHTVDRDLIERVDKALSGPMIGFALLVLPLLMCEFLWRDDMRSHPGVHFALETASSIIWLAFTLELIVMVSIARRKFRYLADHWIDVLIVLLPMVQIMPMLRLAYVGRLANLGRISRIYRTRGLAMRAFRALLLLDSVQRLLHLNPQKRLDALQDKLEDHYYEIARIEQEMEELQARIAEQDIPPFEGDHDPTDAEEPELA